MSETGLLTEMYEIGPVLHELSANVSTMRALLERATNVEEFGHNENGLSVKLQPVLNRPIIVTSVLAVFPATSTSVQIQLGPERLITVPPASGIFNPQSCRIQLEPEDLREITIAPAGAIYFALFGHADSRRNDSK